jgi:hypothetical protein
MKTIRIQLEQVKRSKNGNSLVTLNTKPVEFSDNLGAAKICVDFLQRIEESLQLAQQMGQKSVKVGGVNFSLKGKFSVYIVINGQTYSMADVQTLFEGTDTTLLGFKNPKSIFVAMYQILRTAEGKSPLLTGDALKLSNESNNAQFLLS